jgi:hypothetical protein
MDAWSHPDPAAQPSSELDGRVDVQIMETAGEWAKVRGQNGWEGWVDGKLLERIDPNGGSDDRRALMLLAIALVVLLVLAVLGFTAS